MWRLWLLVLFLPQFTLAQDTLRVQADTVIPEVDTMPTPVFQPISAGKAAMRSAILPGYGQWSNRSYWKVPLALGGVGAGIYWIGRNTGESRRYSRSLSARLDGDSTTLDPFFADMSTIDVMQNRVYYKRNVTAGILFTLYAYTINVLDAYTDASTHFEKEDAHPPAKAAFYSALLPGLGQAYNRKFWKIPIVYAGLGTAIYFVVDNSNFLNDLNLAYVTRVDDDPSSSIETEFTQYIQTEALQPTATQVRQFRDYAAFAVAAVYLLNIVDAVVDAHFYNFDLSDDLSFDAYPVFRQHGMERYTGVGLTLNF